MVELDNTGKGNQYLGPDFVQKDLKTAIENLYNRMSVTLAKCRTHSIIEIGGYGDDSTLRATAVYLVGAIANSIEANLKLRKALFNEDNIGRELKRDVFTVIGSPDSNKRFITTRRNPWMWEAMSHMIVHLSRHVEGLHPSGRILAKTSVKHDVNDHGLDLIAIYRIPEGEELGISAGECKAYLKDPSRGIADASKRFKEVDESRRDIDIRATVNQLRGFLNNKDRSELAGTFWRDERSYLPFVCCETELSPKWSRQRKSLGRLDVPVSHKILYPLPLPSAWEKFDCISRFMRKYVKGKEF